MSKMLRPRLGVADDPAALQPSLNDALAAVVGRGEQLMTEVIQGLVRGTAPVGPQSASVLQSPAVKQAIAGLQVAAGAVCAQYRQELSRRVYEGGGKEQAQTEVLRYEDLQLFGNAELDQSLEVARALQEASLAVSDELPTVDSLVCTLMGWRTIQPGLNPLRPEVFVQALQATLSRFVPDAAAREAMVAPAAGLLGAHLGRLYRELSDWLLSSGVEPAVPVGGKRHQGSGATGAQTGSAMQRTLLTLDRLRKLLAGDFDAPAGKQEFLHTVPASMALLQELKQVDVLVKRLEQRPRPAEPVAAGTPEAAAAPKLGQQLGGEVLRLMFDTLAQDQRLMPAYQQRLKAVEPAVRRLAEQDSRFFSDRTHPARQFLDRVTQRSLAFKAETDPGWPRFLETVDYATRWLVRSKVVDASTFKELLEHLESVWSTHDQSLRERSEEAARALQHAEQRNLLAQQLAAEFEQRCAGLEVAPFVTDFLRNSWSQVVAEAKINGTDGSPDPHGYRALVEDLVWSVQKASSQRDRASRLVQMVPRLLAGLRSGLERIHYPPELTQRFFDSLMTLHQAALKGSEDPAARQAAEALESAPTPLPAAAAQEEPWIAGDEAQESGWLGRDSVLPPDAGDTLVPVEEPMPQGLASAPPVNLADLRTGTWVELVVEGHWTRVQLTWASPHGTLFMFTSPTGTAHSMSRRTLERLRAQDLVRVVAERPVVDDAFDQVARAALRNSLDGGPGSDGDPSAR